MSREAFQATVHGRVQGVGFRFFVVQRARDLGLDGYARNLADGSVEVYAEGDRTHLESLLRMLEAGPELAEVRRVERRFGEPHGRVRGFYVR